MKIVMLIIRWFVSWFGMREEPKTTVAVGPARKRSMTPCHVSLYASGNPPMAKVIPFPSVPRARVPKFDEHDTLKDLSLPDAPA